MRKILFMTFMIFMIFSSLVKAETQITTNKLLNLSISTETITFNETKNTAGASDFNLTFTGTENETFNISIPQNSTATNGKLILTGFPILNYTYQEDANATGCTGDWDVTHTCALAYDGDWATYGEGDPDAYYFANYTKPVGVISAMIQIKHGNTPVTVNLTVNSTCFNQDPIQIEIWASSSVNFVKCWNGASWISMSSSGADPYLYEEGMFWRNNYNSSIDVGGDGDWDWTVANLESANQTSNFSTEINDFLASCSPDSNGNCNVTFIANLGVAGNMQFSGINITYDYNVTPLFTLLSSQYAEAGIGINQTDGVNYTLKNISNNISISGFYLNYSGSAPTSCKANGTSGTVDSSLKSCNLTISFNRGNKLGNFSTYWTKGNKITKTDKGSARDINSTILLANSSGWNWNTSWYYWNVTLELNDTDTANYTNVVWNNYLAGANFSYVQNISGGTVPLLNYTENVNITSRFRTKVVDVTETIVDVGAVNYEKDVTLIPPTNVDNAFMISYYNNTFVNVTLSTGFTGYRLYKWNGHGWDDVTGDPTHLYNFTASTGSATFYNPYFSSTALVYYSIASTSPSSSPTLLGGGSGQPPTIVIGPSGNWTLLKTNAFLVISAGSTITSFFTIDNRKDVNITKIDITCLNESDPNGLCKYVKYGDMLITGGTPMFQTFTISPGQTADISYTISLPSDLNLKPFNTYNLVLMIDIANERKPFTVTVWYVPGGDVISGSMIWFSGSSTGIPNWAISIVVVIVIIILFVLALGKLTGHKKMFKLKKIRYF